MAYLPSLCLTKLIHLGTNAQVAYASIFRINKQFTKFTIVPSNFIFGIFLHIKLIASALYAPSSSIEK